MRKPWLVCNIVYPFLQLLPRHAHTHTQLSTISCLSFWFGSPGLLPPVGKQAPHTPPTFCPANCNQPASQRSPYTPKILLRGHADWYKIFPLSPQKVATSVMQQFVQYIICCVDLYMLFQQKTPVVWGVLGSAWP